MTKGALKIAVIGDSIGEGYEAKPGMNGHPWPEELAQYFKDNNYNIDLVNFSKGSVRLTDPHRGYVSPLFH